MELRFCTWPEVETYLKNSRAVVIPIGSTEQHGPNGLIGTDALCPESLALKLGEETGALIAPTISVGMAQHHLGFPGSITLRPTTLIAVLEDVVGSLARNGFTHFYFLNGHGGNIATVSAAFSQIHASTSLRASGDNRPALRLKISNWWGSPAVQEISRRRFGGSEGSHATPSEVSLTYFAHPDHVKDAEMSPGTAPRGTIRDAEDYRRQFPDGRIGSDPSLASVEAGEELFHAAVKDIGAEYQRFLSE